jgi:hypothetical protein
MDEALGRPSVAWVPSPPRGARVSIPVLMDEALGLRRPGPRPVVHLRRVSIPVLMDEALGRPTSGARMPASRAGLNPCFDG